MTEENFLAAIRAEPSDDTVRLAYADWLEERGGSDDLARAGLIRSQCWLAKGTHGPHATHWLHVRRCSAAALKIDLARYQPLPDLPPCVECRTERGLLGDLRVFRWMSSSTTPSECASAAFEVLSRHPIRSVTLAMNDTDSPTHVRELVRTLPRHPSWRHVRWVSSGGVVGKAAAFPLLRGKESVKVWLPSDPVDAIYVLRRLRKHGTRRVAANWFELPDDIRDSLEEMGLEAITVWSPLE